MCLPSGVLFCFIFYAAYVLCASVNTTDATTGATALLLPARVNVNTTDATAGATALLLPAQNTHTLRVNVNTPSKQVIQLTLSQALPPLPPLLTNHCRCSRLRAQFVIDRHHKTCALIRLCNAFAIPLRRLRDCSATRPRSFCDAPAHETATPTD